MANCFPLISLVLLLFGTTVRAQYNPNSVFRLGATVSFGLSNMAGNNVGIGGIAGAEKLFSQHFAAELEAAYNYFTGDKAVYMDAHNNAYAIPLLAGIKAYPTSNIYASLRTGAVYLLLNHMNTPAVRLGYGGAAGINLPKKTNRLNIQMAYTAFRHDGISRGYATLAAAIIIK
jgi:hypothetical protein